MTKTTKNDIMSAKSVQTKQTTGLNGLQNYWKQLTKTQQVELTALLGLKERTMQRRLANPGKIALDELDYILPFLQLNVSEDITLKMLKAPCKPSLETSC